MKGGKVGKGGGQNGETNVVLSVRFAGLRGKTIPSTLPGADQIRWGENTYLRVQSIT